MKKQLFINILAVITGFLTIAFLSSIAAYLQAKIFPSSIHIFENPDVVENAVFILILKLFTVLLCCVAGGFICGKISKWRNATIWISVLMAFVIAYIWFSTGQPFWFWLTLMLGIYPGVHFGNSLVNKTNIQTIKK